MRTWIAALGLLGLMTAGTVHAGYVEQRMTVGVEVVAPCTIESAAVRCTNGQHPQTRIIDKPSPSNDGRSDMNKDPTKDGEVEAFLHHFEVIF